MSNVQIVAAALKQTDPSLWSEVGGETFKKAVQKKGARVLKYRRYERGDHDTNLTDQQRQLLNIISSDAELEEMCANYCSIVVDRMAGRIRVADISSDQDDVNDWLNSTMTRNKFKSKQGEWIRGAIRDGESFVLVDPQTALWSSEPAFDGYSGVTAIYDNITGLPLWACKLWMVSEPADITGDAKELGEEDVVYVVVYQRDRITYWQGKSGTYDLKATPVQESGLKTVDDGNGYEWDLGLIPLVQFANKRDNYTSHGESEIRVVVPLQDILNGTLYDMMMASKLSAFKIYWSIGMSIDKDGIVPGSVVNLVLEDEDGQEITNVDENLARFLSAVKVGEFGTTDMSQYTNQLDKLEREISQVSATPIYGITSKGNLSGEALKQLESGLLNKIIRWRDENESQVQLLFRLTARVQETFDVSAAFNQKFSSDILEFLDLAAPLSPPKVRPLAINVSWADPEIKNTGEMIKSLSDMRSTNPDLWPDKMYRGKIGALLGMSGQEIEELSDEADVDKATSIDRLISGRTGEIGEMEL